MFDRLFELLGAIYESLVPWVIIQPYERGLVTRLGRFKGELQPGFHWRIPWADVVFNDHVTPHVSHLVGHAITTKDDKCVDFDAVVTWRIEDLRVATFEVTDVKEAIQDACAGQIATALKNTTWDDIRVGDVLEKLPGICRRRARKWGIEVIDIQFSTLALVRNYRVSGGAQPHTVHLTPNPGL